MTPELTSHRDTLTIAGRAVPRWLPILSLLLLVALVFGRTVGHEFVNLDDDVLIYSNANLVPPTWTGLVNHWRKPHASLYIPAVYTVWWCIAQVALLRDPAGGYALNPWLFHLANLIVHGVNVWLVWRILRSVIRDDVASWIGAALFAVHPLQTEPVAWATAMKDLLCGMFSLLAIAAALHAVLQSRRPARWWIAATLSFIAALLSKPSAVSLPIVIALLLHWGGGSRRPALIVLFGGLVLALPVLLVTHYAQPASDVVRMALWSRPLVAADALGFYLQKIIWPFNLTIDYGRTPTAIFSSGAAWWTWIAPAAITAGVLITRRRVFIIAWLIMIAALAPNLGLLPFQYQIFSTVSDRYAYLALLGVAIAVAGLLTIAPKLRIIGVIVVLLLACDSFIQAANWRDAESFWRHAVTVNPRSGLAYGNLGVLLLDRGDAAGALPVLQHAAALDPNDAFAPMNLVRANLALGNTAAAAQNAIDLETAYRRRADFNPALTAAVLDRFAAAIERRGDAESADRLRRESARLGKP